MPGRRSLDEQQYYGNPHNAFWRIMSRFTEIEATSEYEKRVQGLIASRIAVWDVIRCCVRPGSLDSDIDAASIEVNDFEEFFREHPQIQAVFFNGGRAAQEYARRVVPVLTAAYKEIPSTQLLSTSPANARYSFDRKQENWMALETFLERQD